MIEIKAKNIKDVIKIIDDKKMEKAIYRALKESTRRGIKEAVKKTREIYTIKAKDLKSVITSKIYAEKLKVIIIIDSEPLSLRYFGAKKKRVMIKPKNSNKKRAYYGVTYKIYKKDKRKLHKKAFFTPKGDVKERRGAKPYPIREVRVISPTTMLKNRGLRELYEIFDSYYLDRVMHHYKYYTKQL